MQYMHALCICMQLKQTSSSSCHPRTQLVYCELNETRLTTPWLEYFLVTKKFAVSNYIITLFKSCVIYYYLVLKVNGAAALVDVVYFICQQFGEFVSVIVDSADRHAPMTMSML